MDLLLPEHNATWTYCYMNIELHGPTDTWTNCYINKLLHGPISTGT